MMPYSEVFISEPKREAGFYWVKRSGELLPAQYIPFTTEEIEEDYIETHPEAAEDTCVFDYGWTLDFDYDEGRIFYDGEFEWIGPRIEKPALAEAERNR